MPKRGSLTGPPKNSKRFNPSPPNPLSLKIRSEFDPSAKRRRPNFQGERELGLEGGKPACVAEPPVQRVARQSLATRWRKIETQSRRGRRVSSENTSSAFSASLRFKFLTSTFDHEVWLRCLGLVPPEA